MLYVISLILMIKQSVLLAKMIINFLTIHVKLRQMMYSSPLQIVIIILRQHVIHVNHLPFTIQLN